MSIITTIKNLDMNIDDKCKNKTLNNSLELYHTLIDNGIMQPRGNQLNRSGYYTKSDSFQHT